MHPRALQILAFAALTGASLGSASSPAMPPAGEVLVGLTSGSTAAVSGELVRIDPTDGKTRPLTTIDAQGGHGSPSDLVRTPNGKGLLVAQIEFLQQGNFSRLQHVEARTGKVRKLVDVGPGGLDCLAWDAQGRLLATLSPSAGGNQQLVELDPASGKTTVRGPLNGTFLRSLAFGPGHQPLYGLQTAGATWPDALVTVDPADGTLLSIVRLELSEAATALEVESDGTVLVIGAAHTLFEVDPATGKGQARGRTAKVLVVGLDTLP